MCGIAGIVSRLPGELIDNKLSVMSEVQAHRGPDGQGRVVHRVERWNVGLAHRRLSIIDLSAAALQPMRSSDGRQWLIYNGELYNYRELRRALESEGARFCTQSDTEVVLQALRAWGPEKAFGRFNGMWALALLDLDEKSLLLSRDRVGVKPLYIWKTPGELFFASEIKAILRGSGARLRPNYRLINAFLAQSLLDIDDETLFDGIQKLPPGQYAVIDLRQPTLTMTLHRFWEISSHNFLPQDENTFMQELRETFFDAVRLRLRSDVPVGALLSGGVDSSSIVAVMAATLPRDTINLLSGVSHDSRFDESPFIDLVANHFGLRVHKVVTDFAPRDALDLLERAIWFNDEPVGSFANVVHHLLMQKAKELGVTVILSGQGGDELLAGYKKYTAFYAQWLQHQGYHLKAVRVLYQSWRQGTVIKQFSLAEAKRYLPLLMDRELDVRGPALREFPYVPMGLREGMTVNERQAEDLTRFSVPLLLHTEDRMSMAASREIRVPFLDYRLVEMLIPLDMSLKIRNGWTKWVFRKAMEPFLPKEVIWRRDKQGFVNPQSEWLKNELRPEIEKYFSGDSFIFLKGLIDRQLLLLKYDKYCRQPPGKGRIWFREIFNPLALEIWLRKFEGWLD